jgi:predicted CXXCH cytochrome family protein
VQLLFRLSIVIISFNTLSAHGQGILNSPHDFSNASWNRGKETCLGCHASHDAQSAEHSAPLWNRQDVATSYAVYTSATMNAVVGQPDGSSKLCLSCHDGTVALDSFGGAKNGSTFISKQADLEADLSDDHPVSFVYDSALAKADGALHDPSTHASGLGASIDRDLLEDHKMQCTSCHTVHNKSRIKKFLVMQNSRSALCLTCHDK